MNDITSKQLSPWRFLWLIALMGLPALGWLGVLDRSSSADINASITNAGLIYGTARGINALVSLLQGTELNFLVLTFSIGEILDPVNDLIERFSEVILLALGSLALQKILLVLVSHTLFNILLSIVAVCTGLSLFLSYPRLLSALLRTFLIIAFFRFSLALVVMANHWVDASFLDIADKQRHVAMEKFQGELRKIDSLTSRDEEAAAQLVDLQQKLAKLKVHRSESASALTVLDAKIQTARNSVEAMAADAGSLCKISDLSPTCPEHVKKAKEELQLLISQQKTAVSTQDKIEESMQNYREQMDCLEKHQRGESCSFWDSLPDAPDTAALRHKLNQINAGLSDFADNCINLLVSLLLKTVAIPLIFIYLLIMLMRMNWAKI